MTSTLARLLRLRPDSAPLLYRQIYESAEITSLAYLLDLLFSAGIATLGLVLNSPAVVIGAMLVSPLMSPILAVGLAFAASDVYLALRSLYTLVGSILVAIGFSAALVWVLPFQSPTSEILARTQPNLLDLGVAVFSGLAGSVVMARGASGGGASALPGVAIAVALMPPLCTVGFGVGSGGNWQIISGAGLLFLTNLAAIASSAFLVFYLLGMNQPEVRAAIGESQMKQAAGTRLYSLLHDSPFGRLFGDVGHLRWRIVMVLVTFALLFVPLRRSLMQLASESVSRAAVRETMRALAPPDAVLSQQVEILPDRIIERVVTTSQVDRTKVAAAEAELSRRTGKKAQIEIRQVANEEELVLLRERLRAPDPPPPPQKLAAYGPPVRSLVEGPLKEIWPAQAAELVHFEAGFAADSPVIRCRYRAPKPLDPAAVEVVAKALGNALGAPTLQVDLVWERPVVKR